jgi:hypothetical protein
MKNICLIVEVIEIRHSIREKSIVSVEVIEIPPKHEKAYIADMIHFNNQYPLLLFKPDGLCSLDEYGHQTKL